MSALKSVTRRNPTHTLPWKRGGLTALLFSALLSLVPAPSFAIDPKFELDPAALKKYAIPPSPQAAQRPAAGGAAERLASYTLKPGEDLRQVVSREYGVSGAKAEALLEKIKQVNHLSELTTLQAGSTLLIPAADPGRARKGAGKPAAKRFRNSAKAAPARSPYRRAALTAPRARLKERPAELLADRSRLRAAEMAQAKETWHRLVPPGSSRDGHFDYRSSSFALALDAERYPTLPAQDGGSILVDGRGTLPALVKTLIQQNNPQVRIVTDDPAEPRSFYRALLSAARFYSFEEDFSVDFGADPKITVRSDFKIEKAPESLMQHDITLLNVSAERYATPQGLAALLERNGFQLLETAAPRREAGPAGDLLYQISYKEPQRILDLLLDALAVPFESGIKIDIYAQDNIGVRLEVPVDRFFEYGGRRYVVGFFKGDPVTYTLTRLLELKGYRVIMLQDSDDLRSITDQVLSRLQLPGRYAEHELWPSRPAGYGVRVSGVLIRGDRNGEERKLFVTDRQVDPLVQELAELNGYRLLGAR